MVDYAQLFSRIQSSPGRGKDVIFLLLALSTVLSSCRREEPTTWTPSVAGPLAYGSIGIDDLIADSLITADDNCLWHFHLTDELTDFDLDSIVSIPDTSIHKLFELPFNGGPWTIGPDVTLLTIGEETTFDVSGASLREVIAKSGWLAYTVRSYVNGYIDCTYLLPGLTLNGQPVELLASTTPSVGDVPSVVTGVVDLTGHHLDLTGEDGFQSNTLNTLLTLRTSADAPSSAIVFGDDSVVIDLHFMDPKVLYARGYFGQHTYDLDETIDFSSGFTMPEGSLRLDQVELKLRVENYVGVDAQIQFSEVQSINANSGSAVDLDYPAMFDAVNITRAVDQDGIVTPDISSWDILTANSNINAFIENLPTGLSMGAHVSINPLGDVSDGNDFIYTAQALNAIAELDIPLAIGMQNLVLRDTLKFSADIGMRVSGSMYLRIDNYFPLDARVDAILIRDGGMIYRTLLDNAWIPAAWVGSDPLQPVPTYTELEIPVDEDLLLELEAGAELVLRVELNTPGYPEPVGIYKPYRMDVRIIGDGEVEVTVE